MCFRRGASGPHYYCPRCNLTHGAHKSSGRFHGHRPHEEGEPLGVPCDEETKQLRHEAHAQFDPLWQHAVDPTETRGRAYSMLSQLMQLKPGQCHIARFGRSQCLELLAKVAELRQWV